MSDLPGLNIIVPAADGRRFYAALETAMTAAALGHRVRIFLQGDAAAMLRQPIGFAGDAALKKAGLPKLAALVDEATALGVELTVCQSGMALAHVVAADLVPQARTGGLVSFMADIEPADRIITY